jgi:hypothetical protein
VCDFILIAGGAVAAFDEVNIRIADSYLGYNRADLGGALSAEFNVNVTILSSSMPFNTGMHI